MSKVNLATVREIGANMLHIMHALVDGMAIDHMARIVHTNVNPFNIVLDFTKDMKVQIGIIDWGLLLEVPSK